jgi:hypothetical protein
MRSFHAHRAKNTQQAISAFKIDIWTQTRTYGQTHTDRQSGFEEKPWNELELCMRLLRIIWKYGKHSSNPLLRLPVGSPGTRQEWQKPLEGRLSWQHWCDIKTRVGAVGTENAVERLERLFSEQTPCEVTRILRMPKQNHPVGWMAESLTVSCCWNISPIQSTATSGVSSSAYSDFTDQSIIFFVLLLLGSLIYSFHMIKNLIANKLNSCKFTLKIFNSIYLWCILRRCQQLSLYSVEWQDD